MNSDSIHTRQKAIRSDSLLLLTSIIWGLAFVAQRMGMDHVGPFIFNGIRFALGALVIIPFIYFSRRKRSSRQGSRKYLLRGGIFLGITLFAGATLQQYGLVYTTAGKAGFITGLYVVFVPLLGLFRREYPHVTVWFAALLAAVGMYFLSVNGGFEIVLGDVLVLLGAVFWALHVVIIGVMSPKVSSLQLALVQYLVCSILSIIVALGLESNTMEGIVDATIPILYGGVLSVGIAYTLQVVAQKNAPPAHAAIILSLEAVFAAIGGWLILGEHLDNRQILGCLLMMTGMLVAQFTALRRKA